jgi:hypothetical protein
MTPKEKANELVDMMYFSSLKITKKDAKNCALIAVQHVINANPHSNPLNTEVHSTMGFWINVKKEIEKL